MSVHDRLKQLGMELPTVTPPVGSYVPAIQIGNLIHTSGQLPMIKGELTGKGKVPTDTPLPNAQQAARVAVLNALAAAAQSAGGLDRIERVVRVGVFVNSALGFTDQAKVANGASDFLVELFGEKGKHVRAAVGVCELPLNAAVELELTIQVRS